MTHLFARVLLVTLATLSACVCAAAEPLVCDTLKLGDTAASAAERVTGSADNRHQRWFRIVDSANSRIIPKARYDRILVGWQVCIPSTHLAPQLSSIGSPKAIAAREVISTPPEATPPVEASPPPVEASPAVDAEHTATDWPSPDEKARDLALFFLGTVAFGAAMAVGWHGAERFLTNRRTRQREVHDFGHLFVKNFERPLVIDGVVPHPIRARTRWVPFHRQLDILLAPAPGRRYPNLHDHRRNVEYDVARIAHRLRHHPFVQRPLRTEGQWVVVPFRLKPRRRTGDRI
ncbi:MAG TPA: hypothetical protein VFI56_22180 [Vicinamibacterales bacterium]|nr:hypothetical protein [Vicinamibacterales bacterium]